MRELQITKHTKFGRKGYICDQCGGAIAPGEPSVRVFEIAEREVCNQRHHPDCDDAWRAVHEFVCPDDGLEVLQYVFEGGCPDLRWFDNFDEGQEAAAILIADFPEVAARLCVGLTQSQQGLKI